MLRIFLSPAAADRLRAAREFLASFAPGTEVLVVSTNRGAADDLVRSLATEQPATFGLHRFSLTQLAFRIAAGELAARGLTPITPLASQATAAHVTYSLASKGELPYFSRVSDYPGFPLSLASTLQEVRLAGVSADRIVESAAADLGRLLERYNEELDENRFSDRAVLFELATSLVNENPPSIVRSPVLLLDVAVESKAQKEFLRGIVGASADVFATVHTADERTREFFSEIGSGGSREPEILRRASPAQDDTHGRLGRDRNIARRAATQVPRYARDDTGGRRDAGAPHRNAGAPHRDAGAPHTEIVLPAQRAPRRSLERLRANLFSPGAPAAGEFDESVVFFSAAGEGREAVEITRAILQHARRGTRFDEMAVFLRAPAKYQAHLEAAFERAGVPHYFARGSRRPDPSGRALLALLACAAEGLSAKRFSEYLSLGQVPEAPSSTWVPPEDQRELIDENDLIEEETIPSAEHVPDESASYGGNLREPYRWEDLLVEAAVIGGKDRWVRRLNGLEAEFRRKLTELTTEEPESGRIEVIERQLLRLHHLRDFALPIIEQLDALQGCTTWKEWIAALRNLVSAALRKPDRVLEVLAELEPMSEITPVTIDEVRVTLADRLSSLEVRPPRRRFGRVFVAPIEQAAGRSFKVVFIPGVVERGFPQKVREDPLLLDDLRALISADLIVSTRRASEERLLLQIAVGAADETLYVSYPRIDAAQGRSRVASFYSLDVIRAVTGRIPDHEELEITANRAVGARLAWPAPRESVSAIDDLEHDLAVLGPRLEIRTPGDQAGRARYLLELNSFLAQSLRARYMRWEKDAWNHFDGITRKSDAIASVLDENSLRARPYSPSALQRYAACPYQFFLSAILRLEPREEPEPPVRLDPLTRGTMIHAMHAATLKRLKARGMLPLMPHQIAEAEEVLQAVVTEVAEKWKDELAPAILRVWNDEITMIRTDLRLWLREIAAEPERWIAEHYEFAFGLTRSTEHDEDSRPDPVRLPGDWLLRGSVDLVERRAVLGDLRVTDYKTGANRTIEGLVIGGGEQLQPLLYALAVEKILGAEVAVSRLFFSTSKGGFSKREVEVTDESRKIATNVLAQIDAAVASGFLPPAPRAKTKNRRWVACDYCDFITVCGPYEPLRMLRKKPERLVPLVRLRDHP